MARPRRTSVAIPDAPPVEYPVTTRNHLTGLAPALRETALELAGRDSRRIEVVRPGRAIVHPTPMTG